ncbi:hypothetical protein AJ80_01211 [Polytolypa hystricis UAMH7299]|uniref:Aminoglycoside phosphotransferase domain-containing protein n=1 Tax=Polytolypa hystricis (strain UAMH7299) TaxID=1447883 RepID=A0A2B7YZB1_POLH7|nr:hypothetical protein AJ80_01211 [Polytolypa hystricis UAMH7299]
MNSYILNRCQGSINPAEFHIAQKTRLVHCLEPAQGIRFSSYHASSASEQASSKLGGDREDYNGVTEVWAHKAGVNVLATDPYEKRYMLSGGADASIHLWDLESRNSELNHVHKSTASVTKSSNPSAHTHALTSLSIYPFDPTPSTILTTSHDTTLKLSSLTPPSILPVHTFSLHSTPYSHSFSAHPSSLLLVAVGTSEKSVRLLDMRSGLSTHALPGHNSAVLSVSWAPHREYLLSSASTDNRVLIFDVRRGGHNSTLASLDMDDAVGVLPPEDAPASYYGREPFSLQARAHNGAVTGVRWTSNGTHLITSGQDSRIRVWDASTGANTLVHFGPRIRNSSSLHLAERAPLILPRSDVTPGRDMLMWPNYNDPDDRGEIFMFELRDGTFIKRLNVPGMPSGASRQKMRGRPTALSAARINALAWRGNGGSGEGMEMFSGHGDGTIRAWVSRTPDDVEEENEEEQAEQEEKKRKRDVLEEVYRGLMEPNLLSVVGAAYLHAHRRAQYRELPEDGRYNLQTINTLHDEVIGRPEIDLRDRFPSDYARRYRWAMPKAKAPGPQQSAPPCDWVRERLDAINTASILYPLSDQASALLQKYSETNGYSCETSLAASLKKLILDSERLFELRIRGVVVKCSDEIVIKVFPDSRDLAEYHNLQYLADHACDLPIPRTHGLIMLGNLCVMLMSYIPGVTLEKAWPGLSHEAKLSLQKQLDLIFSRLRSLRQDDGPELGSAGGEAVKDYRIMEIFAYKGITTARGFDELQFSAKHRASPCFVKLLRSFLEEQNKTLRGSVFTHGDLKKSNIMVKQDPRNADAYAVTGIIDWEDSGFYPEYHECTTLSNGQSIMSDDDWYLYVPDCISPLRLPVRCVLLALIIASVCINNIFLFQPIQNIEEEILATIIRLLVADRRIPCNIFDVIDLCRVDFAQGTELDKRIRNKCVQWHSHVTEITLTSTEELDGGLIGLVFRIDE